jgi:hypothetical protein
VAISRCLFLVGLFASSIIASNIADAAILTPVSSPNEFLAPVTYTNNFEDGAANSSPPATIPFTFESSAKVGLASAWTAGTTSSGLKGLVESVEDKPMRIQFSQPVGEVGMYFGNDDFGRKFDAILELFDASQVSMGLVKVRSNGNDLTDQFIGVRSSAPVMSATIAYQQPNAQLLSVFIDDLRVGLIPEPTSMVMLICWGVALTWSVNRIRLRQTSR